MPAIATVAAVAGIVAAAYPILDSIAREKNSKKAVKLRNELNVILSKYNLKISDLRNEIERRGLDYNKIVESLNTVSPAGSAFKVREQAYSDKRAKDAEQMDQINKLQRQADLVTADYNKKSEDYDSRGFIRTIIK
jgi:hypothetical protein